MTRARSHPFVTLLALVVLAGVVAGVRRLRSERSVRRELDGTGPVHGSLDTWPLVPRAPAPAVPAPSAD